MLIRVSQRVTLIVFCVSRWLVRRDGDSGQQQRQKHQHHHSQQPTSHPSLSLRKSGVVAEPILLLYAPPQVVTLIA